MLQVYTSLLNMIITRINIRIGPHLLEIFCQPNKNNNGHQKDTPPGSLTAKAPEKCCLEDWKMIRHSYLVSATFLGAASLRTGLNLNTEFGDCREAGLFSFGLQKQKVGCTDLYFPHVLYYVYNIYLLSDFFSKLLWNVFFFRVYILPCCFGMVL